MTNGRSRQGSRAWVVVKERAVFWLHASNLRGSQSAPLVLDPPPAPAKDPAPPLPSLPKVAAVPLPPRPASARPGLAAKGWWIQFAVLSNPRNVARLRRNLKRMHRRMRALHLRPVVIWDGPPVQVLARMAP
jgi:hypothetical protein